MPLVRFYSVGNGDSSQIVLANNKRLLFDFRQVAGGTDEDHPVIDLAATLRAELAAERRDYFDVVAFTHGDLDHIAGAIDFFELEHAAKYQGKDRIKIRELWVPAQMITDTDPNAEGEVLRAEARHRLREGRGIRVFSRPEKLRDWFEKNGKGVTLASRQHLISDAGTVVPGFTQEVDLVEFFVHSPFMKHTDHGDEDRNLGALILHATFKVAGRETRYLMTGDSDYSVMSDIVKITRAKGRTERLRWDIYNLPHHCSYLALAEEKGNTITTPHPDVAWLLDQGESRCNVVCSSIPVPDDAERKMPPHIQAKRAYDKVANAKRGEVYVTGESTGRKGEPVAIELEITGLGVKKLSLPVLTGSGAISAAPAHRAG